MKVILAPIECEPSCQMECDCGEQFWVDPCTEENLQFNGRELKAVCPKCGKRDEQEAS